MKVTVFELLKLVREGKAPKEIKYDTINYFFRNYDYKEIREGLIDEQSSWLERIDFYKFDEEVEIIEEDKKIEKLTIGKTLILVPTDEIGVKASYSDDYNTLANKINEIIDILNEMREDK